VEERLSGGATGTTTYFHGPGVDQHLAQDQGGTVSYFAADHLGSVTDITTSAGAISLTRRYDPWGNLLSGASTGGYAFTGREWDAETGLYYYRARYYDPRMGRFIAEDPIRFDGGVNFYAYVGGNPLAFTDPLGLCDKICGIKKGPEYNVSGTVPAGTTLTFHADFLNDATHDPKCCEVRQLVSWQKGPGPNWFKPPHNRPNTWYEDRAQDGKRLRRAGGLNPNEEPNYYHGNEYDGRDRPYMEVRDLYSFRLIVVDLCRRGKTIYTSRTIRVRMGGE
jgi:RHS repeat-associated protein